MRRVIIDVATLGVRKGRPRPPKSLSASPAEIAIARQMAERDRAEQRETAEQQQDH